MGGWGRDDDSGPEVDSSIVAAGYELTHFTHQLIRGAITGSIVDPWSADTLCTMNRIVARPEHESAGCFRDGACSIFGSRHTPPSHERVPDLVTEACRELQQLIDEGAWFRSAAYALWRVCWIHPFAEGNGRTARMFSYAVLSYGILSAREDRGAALQYALPGSPAVPQLLKINRLSYQRALEAADRAALRGSADCEALASLLFRCLEAQLSDATPLLDDTPEP